MFDLSVRPFFVLSHAFGYQLPRRFGADEDVHPYLNLRITVYAPQGDPMNVPLVNSA